jgi:acyl transferase domain-containing protein
MSREPRYSARTRQPIAIVGIACQLPGAPNVRAFWDVLRAARNTITPAPPDQLRAPTGNSFSYGGFLDKIDLFDARFFGISPFEAVRIDPHHRLLMQTVWEALEDAGLPADDLAGSRTGVYTTCFTGDYWNQLQAAGIQDAHALVGAHRSAVPAGRISYLLDLRGPSIETEAACASSLVATHLACQAIWSGEVSLSIVGAVNLLLRSDDRTGLAEAGAISPTYHCRFGDEDADGYVPAEGAVAVILKPLDDAIAAGDRVYATILGSGVSSSGRQVPSLAGTSATGLEDLMRTVLHGAGVAAADVDYVEAHGTGTPKGDAVEFTALGRVLGEGRDPDQRCLVGSVKSNIGHTESAAGLVGLAKVALALHHRTIPATLHVHRPNPILRTEGAALELSRTTAPWPDRGRAGIAGVTSLGMMGTGAHVVLSGAPEPTPRPDPPRAARSLLIPLSAKDPAALARLAADYADTLDAATDPTDVCYSAGARRTHLPHRLAVTGPDRRTLADRLRRYAERDPLSPALVASGRAGRPGPVVFVFSGQGSQWLGMARELFATEPVFADSMRECDRLIHAEGDWSLIDRLHQDRPMTVEREIQPALWAIQVSLARLWRHWGVEPDLVLGHSMGEVAAATVAGALSPRDGAAVICRRSTLVGTLPTPGALVAVELDEHEAIEAIGEFADRVSVAVANGNHACVLAGEPSAVDAVVEPLRARGVFCRTLQVNYAAHSPHVEPLREAMLACGRGPARCRCTPPHWTGWLPAGTSTPDTG